MADSNLVARLRESTGGPLAKEAADALAEQAETIERLRATLKLIASVGCDLAPMASCKVGESCRSCIASEALRNAPEISDAR